MVTFRPFFHMTSCIAGIAKDRTKFASAAPLVEGRTAGCLPKLTMKGSLLTETRTSIFQICLLGFDGWKKETTNKECPKKKYFTLAESRTTSNDFPFQRDFLKSKFPSCSILGGCTFIWPIISADIGPNNAICFLSNQWTSPHICFVWFPQYG